MIQDDLVVLDTRADSYLCFPDLGACVLDDRRLNADASVVIAPLIAEGLLSSELHEHPYPTRLLPPAPTRACRAESSRPIAPHVAVSLAATWAGLAPRRLDIAELALKVGRRRVGRCDPDALVHRVDAFRRLFPIMPWVGECLFQSGWLLEFLGRDGQDATWVFGVRLRPFAAHCWLQIDDLALTDAPEALAAYHPMLAI